MRRWIPRVSLVALSRSISLVSRQLAGKKSVNRHGRKPLITKVDKGTWPPPTLYEQLFPDGGKVRRTPNGLAVPEKVPNIVPALGTQSSNTTTSITSKGIALLVISASSRSLIEADFRLPVRKSRHLPGWSGPARASKVFPGRNAQTLSQANHYFLVFGNVAEAQTYMKHLESLSAQMHRTTLEAWASALGQNSSIKTIRKRPRGEVQIPQSTAGTVDKQILAFNTLPRDHSLRVRLLEPPFTRNVRALLEQKGHSLTSLVRPAESEHAGKTSSSTVLLWCDEAPSPSTEQVCSALIEADEIERNFVWNCSVRAIMSGTRVRRQRNAIKENATNHSDDLEQNSQSEISAKPLRWMITFSCDSDAQRFLQRWHRRPFPFHLTDDTDSGRDESIMNVEILWQ